MGGRHQSECPADITGIRSIVGALRKRGRYHSGEGIEGGLDASVRFGKDLEQGELDRADGDHPASVHPPRDGSMTAAGYAPRP